MAVIAILIDCRYLIDPLAKALEQRMIRMAHRPRVFDPGCGSFNQAASAVHFPHEKKTGAGGDLCPLKIKLDGFVESWMNAFLLLLTNH